MAATILTDEWNRLKSGTDIRGDALEGVASHPVTLTIPAVKRIAAGFACWLAAAVGKPCNQLTVSVGRDSRLTGPSIAGAVMETLSLYGIQVMDCGLSSTPAMFMTTVDAGCDGAVQVTASHHPYYRNGLKFFTRSGGLEGSDISSILEYAQNGVSPTPCAVSGHISPLAYMEQYACRLRQMICEGCGTNEEDAPLAGFHIVVDAGNGAGGFYATEVLQPLGAAIEGSQFLEPDGHFPHHIPNPEDAQAMASICAATLQAKADLGVIFDTDVDRAGCVDTAGREINRNRLVALASAIALEDNPGGTIVTDSITSSGLKTFIEKDLAGVHCRFKRGYKNVINEALRLNADGINAPLAIETSGHAAMRENYFLDDGAYLITRIIIKAAQLRKEGKSLDDLIASLQEPVESKELRFQIKVPDFKSFGTQLLSSVESYAASQGWQVADDSREGVRITFGEENGSGWMLLRLSVHDPVMPLNIESDRSGGCKIIARKLAAYFELQPSDIRESLDISALQNYLSEN